MSPTKTVQEQRMFQKYEHWLNSNKVMPRRIVNAYLRDVKSITKDN